MPPHDGLFANPAQADKWVNDERLTRNMPQHIQDIFVKRTPFYIDDTFGGMPDKDMAPTAYRRNTVRWLGPLCDVLNVYPINL
ncbi:hypothetical protein Jann_0893 [Jannaschia sp. CCS1]|nr:hypothetical protein Jann_0893 [Jannaschia sp. CCS1]